MLENVALNHALGTLPLLSGSRTRSLSAENPTGAKGRGAMAVPDPADPDLPHCRAAMELGRGWKVRPFLRPKAGSTVTLMDCAGPGVVQHIWIGAHLDWTGNGRACVLRFYWDGEQTPSAEVPLTDFFASGHDLFVPVNSLPVVANPISALNCYWPMPFKSHARITFTNDLDRDVHLGFQITYAECPVPDTAGSFHALWNRTEPSSEGTDHVVLDGATGEGHYVGTFLAWDQLSPWWLGDGQMQFFVDGDRDTPAVSESWSRDAPRGEPSFPDPFTTAHLGIPLRRGQCKWSMYRWRIFDPVRFQKDLRVTLRAPAGSPQIPGRRQSSDDVCSVAYWYQREPHARLAGLPPLAMRWPR